MSVIKIIKQKKKENIVKHKTLKVLLPSVLETYGVFNVLH